MIYTEQDALFDDPVRRTYRYWLMRRWSLGPTVLFLMQNPSIGDEQRDSKTLRRVRGFADSWGYGALEVCNLFAYVDQKNRAVHEVHDPVGPRNDAVIGDTVQRVCRQGGLVVAAWGAKGTRDRRDEHVTRLVTRHADLHRIGGATREGHPGHPLYLSADLRPEVHRSKRS